MKGRTYLECIWIIEMLKAKPLSLREMNELWVETEESDGMEMERRTFIRHKKAILETFGIRIECENEGKYRYFISNRETLANWTARKWLMNSLAISERMMRCVNLHDRILLDPVPSADKRFDRITEAMKDGRWVTFGYAPYLQQGQKPVSVMPYCLKMYRQRWYLLGRYEDGGFGTYCLDRMKRVEVIDRSFVMDRRFDAAAYFSEVVGVVSHGGQQVEPVIVRAFGSEPCYLRDVPLHQSQVEIGSGNGYSDFAYRLKPNMEFIGYLLQRGDRVRLLSPQHLVEKLRETVLKMADIYRS